MTDEQLAERGIMAQTPQDFWLWRSQMGAVMNDAPVYAMLCFRDGVRSETDGKFVFINVGIKHNLNLETSSPYNRNRLKIYNQLHRLIGRFRNFSK